MCDIGDQYPMPRRVWVRRVGVWVKNNGGRCGPSQKRKLRGPSFVSGPTSSIRGWKDGRAGRAEYLSRALRRSPLADSRQERGRGRAVSFLGYCPLFRRGWSLASARPTQSFKRRCGGLATAGSCSPLSVASCVQRREAPADIVPILREIDCFPHLLSCVNMRARPMDQGDPVEGFRYQP